MSGIFGIFHQDHGPVSMTTLEYLADLLVHRGPDGIHIRQQEYVGLGHCLLRTTPEALHEVLPLVDEERGITLTADVRLDNRRELAELLDIKISCLDSTSDGQLILAAYLQWGVGCCLKLLGDFAFAIWDRPKERFFAARDAVGIKPFYYCRQRQTVTFCSEIRPLVKMQPRLPKINEGMVGELLAFHFSSRRETFFEDIYRLPPAHYLLMEGDRFSICRYWDVSFRNTLYYKDIRDYAAHFLNLFQQSVTARLRSHLPVSAELSGGLDSSSIVVAASAFNRAAGKDTLHPYSLVFPGLPCDEQGYIDSVAKKWGLHVNQVSGIDSRPPDWHRQVLQSFHYPDMPNLSMCDRLVQDVQASNSRVLLSGIGGDEWFCGYGFNLTDLTAHGRWQAICKELHFQGASGYRQLTKRLARVLLWPLIPAVIKKRVCKRSVRGGLPHWLPEAFITRTNLLDRITAADARLHCNSLVDAWHYNYLLSDLEGFFLETLDRHRAFHGVENRYPFLDRNLIEFSLSLPEYQKTFCGETKHLLRCGLKDLLPEKVRNRSDKAEFSYVFGQAFLHPTFACTMDELTIGGNGWVDREKLRSTYRELYEFFKKNPTGSCNRVWPVWFAFATEVWFKTLYN